MCLPSRPYTGAPLDCALTASVQSVVSLFYEVTVRRGGADNTTVAAVEAVKDADG